VALFAEKDAAKDRTAMHAVLWNWYDNVITFGFISNLVLLLAALLYKFECAL
jgi:hypothetical protein